MYSRCSHCQTQRAISTGQLRKTRGLIKCKACGKSFDALPSLSDKADTKFKKNEAGDLLAELAEKKARSGAWGLGSTLSVVILCTQVLYFEGDTLLRQPQIRQGLQLVCDIAACTLPPYKNLDELSLSHGEFQAISEHSYLFSAAITNQSLFSQACPDLKLVLQDFNGQAVAERIFTARQYTDIPELPANETTQISLTVVVTPSLGKIGGYTFALL